MKIKMLRVIVVGFVMCVRHAGNVWVLLKDFVAYREMKMIFRKIDGTTNIWALCRTDPSKEMQQTPALGHFAPRSCTIQGNFVCFGVHLPEIWDKHLPHFRPTSILGISSQYIVKLPAGESESPPRIAKSKWHILTRRSECIGMRAGSCVPQPRVLRETRKGLSQGTNYRPARQRARISEAFLSL